MGTVRRFIAKHQILITGCVLMLTVYFIRVKLFPQIHSLLVPTTDRDDVVFPSGTRVYHFNQLRVNSYVENRDEYWIHKDVLKPNFATDQVQKDDFVTLVTQTTVNHLHALKLLSNVWTGPISVAVFLYGTDVALAQLEMLQLYNGYRKIRQRVTFHMVILKNWTNDTVNEDSDNGNFINVNVKGVQYPFNVLRNVALSSVKGGYAFLTDIDMVPSPNLHDSFLAYMKQLDKVKRQTTAFVIPAFEAFNDTFLARNKPELLNFMTKGYMHSYAHKSCIFCQADTNYPKWYSFEEGSNSSYSIPKNSQDYEPFYILHSKAYPKFDERFKGRGKNRISQVCEVYMSGIDFEVLTDAFMTHRGFRPRREDYNLVNDVIYEKLKAELMVKYNRTDGSRRHC